MGERYWITGVQLGMLKAFTDRTMKPEIDDLLEEIEEKQFIGDAKPCPKCGGDVSE